MSAQGPQGQSPPPPHNGENPGVKLLRDLVQALAINTQAHEQSARLSMEVIRGMDRLAGANHQLASVNQQALGRLAETAQASSEMNDILGLFCDALSEIGPRLTKIRSFPQFITEFSEAYENLLSDDDDDPDYE
jgi:hypothetical protein